MKDISGKYTTLRTARASSALKVAPETIGRIESGDLPKKDPLIVARVAAVQAAKEASRIIPYCHPVPVDSVEVSFNLRRDEIAITVEVKAVAKTGVEMEALTAASVAALVLYDMLKGIDGHMEIAGTKLIEKRGGKGDFTDHPERKLTAAVLVVSDRVSAGEREDETGPMIKAKLEEEGFEVVDHRVVPDDKIKVQAALKVYCREFDVDLVVTTGGTGLSPRDVTPEATAEVIETEIPGLAEAIRAHGQARTPYAMLSRAKAGLIGRSLVVNLPGAKRAVEEGLQLLFPGLLHAFKMTGGVGHENGMSGREGPHPEGERKG